MILETLVVGPLEVNAYLVSEGRRREALVIDPGDEGERILERLNDQELTLKYIVNTHGHFDHIGANRFLKDATGARILIHEKDAPLLLQADEHARAFGMAAEASPEADRTLADGDRIELEGLTLEVLSSPGHTEGGICLLMDRILFTGDTLFAGSIGRTDLPGGSFRKIMISIQERILPLGDHVALYPGHGPSSNIAREKRTNPFLADLGRGFL